ncbi:hypothetical protein GGTG_03627 [Gaeumannomyces tritici R3-111a-1]|uniref:Uncharacterized protein n=1 Tax=Gaeumannomyces tritici (strain R3-111a-1) TaxID=644352 RepID=J3NQS1_GAET3|nr:hypothetical protein GGTG_03627 [Gaeumannomyces tritici R3-111a-1]EJT78527.1 hypothetical protein GGTG_03627 [Gaeumannomyces tritici R3-111a-1]
MKYMRACPTGYGRAAYLAQRWFQNFPRLWPVLDPSRPGISICHLKSSLQAQKLFREGGLTAASGASERQASVWGCADSNVRPCGLASGDPLLGISHQLQCRVPPEKVVTRSIPSNLPHPSLPYPASQPTPTWDQPTGPHDHTHVDAAVRSWMTCVDAKEGWPELDGGGGGGDMLGRHITWWAPLPPGSMKSLFHHHPLFGVQKFVFFF